ncbi:PAAR domain-containing protein [Pseudoduganella chitinolytica]|uniref:PAAR domain-containing protein n=1 Tax=Pseudoduganella chitinolytica TaxID=34070 RepID=A0ABY8BHY3_9BURK|nr:PAAR domain-containing protein [Pseudoduganella chitinolytica]WEF35504.1 PAAR domain-containing protein [Pseudoduganella chitinolytica]
MKHQGRGVIRMNDKTDHGGHVSAVSSGTIVMGSEAALAGDITTCPKCKGDYPIKPDGAGARHQGRPYAYDDDMTACGAKLISSV